MSYPFPTAEIDSGLVDAKYPGTAVGRLTNVLERVKSLGDADLSADWNSVRAKLLWAGGLKEDRSTSHAFNDDNHCDLTTMRGAVSHESNASGAVAGISKRNLLGPHIEKASLAEVGEGGSWSTCTNGCNNVPPHDVAHVQFQSRVAFKLVWCPPQFNSFVLVDDEGKLLKSGTPTGSLPHISYRSGNYSLVKGGMYAGVAEEVGNQQG